MGNRAGISFLRASSLRFGLSEGFSEDWYVNFWNHRDSCTGLGSWEVLYVLRTSLRIPLVIAPFRVNTQKFGKAELFPRKCQNSYQICVPARPAASGSLGYVVLQGQGEWARWGTWHQGEPGMRALPRHRSPTSRGWSTLCLQHPHINWPFFYSAALPLSCLPPPMHM